MSSKPDVGPPNLEIDSERLPVFGFVDDEVGCENCCRLRNRSNIYNLLLLLFFFYSFHKVPSLQMFSFSPSSFFFLVLPLQLHTPTK